MGKVHNSAWTHSWVRSQLDQEPLAFEAEFANLRPVEGVDFCVPLKKKSRHKEKLVFNKLQREPGDKQTCVLSEKAS